jgi:hypothetical protein
LSVEGLAPSPVATQPDQSNHNLSHNHRHHHKSAFSFGTIHRFARRTRSFKEELIERFQGRTRSPSSHALPASPFSMHVPRVSPLPEVPSPSPTSITSSSSSLFASHTNTLRSKLRIRKRSTCSQHSIESGDSPFGSVDFSLLEDSLIMPPPPPPPLPALTVNGNGTLSSPNRQLDHARHFIRQMTNALRYLQGVVEKDMLEQLSGAASILLEIVVTGYAKIKAHLITDHNR